jgi:heterodisulfide reductase subunit B
MMPGHELADFAKSELIDAIASLSRTPSAKEAIENALCGAILYCEIVFGRAYSVPTELFSLLLEDPDKLKELFDVLGATDIDGAIEAARSLNAE